MKLNKEYFKRESTWLNIGEAIVATGVQLAVSIPDDIKAPMWIYIGMRILMGIVQAVKRDIDK